MPKRLISFVLLLAVAVGFGGAARLVHEHAAEMLRPAGADTAVAAAAAEHGEDGDHHDAPHRHSGHDSDNCAVCHALAGPGIDRLPGAMCLITFVDPPTRTRAPVAAPPQRADIREPADARAPPALV